MNGIGDLFNLVAHRMISRGRSLGSIFLILLALFGFSACDEELTLNTFDFTVFGLTNTVAVGDLIVLQAIYTENSIISDVSGTATWSSSDNAVATVNCCGTVEGVSDGTASINAEYNGLTNFIDVYVGSSTPPPAGDNPNLTVAIDGVNYNTATGDIVIDYTVTNNGTVAVDTTTSNFTVAFWIDVAAAPVIGDTPTTSISIPAGSIIGANGGTLVSSHTQALGVGLTPANDVYIIVDALDALVENSELDNISPAMAIYNVGLVVSAPYPGILIGTGVPVTATYTDSYSSTVVNASTAWSTAPGGIITGPTGGIVTGANPGSTTLSGVYAGLTGATGIDVKTCLPLTGNGIIADPWDIGDGHACDAWGDDVISFYYVVNLPVAGDWNFRLLNMNIDHDLIIYSDGFTNVCSSVATGSVDELCTVNYGTGGLVWIEVYNFDWDLFATAGGAYKLQVDQGPP